MSAPILEARQISKVYPGTRALDNVDFTVRPGKVSALLGGNGAGKSTLVKILAGVEQPTSGCLLMNGAEIRLAGARDANRLGIGIIHQELNLCPNLSVAENIFLGREIARAGALLDRKAQERVARDWLQRLAPSIDPRAVVGDLALGEQQIVEISKALARNVRVLMMDEPTSALSASETAALFAAVRDLARRGVGVVYISHRLGEVLQIADSITILRDGRVAGEAPAAATDVRWVIESMTGRPAGDLFPPNESHAGSPVLEVRGLRVPGERGNARVRDVSFQARSGELLGIFGLMGAGRTELLEALMGMRPGATGEILVAGDMVTELSTSERIAKGLALVPEDRQTAGLVQPLSVRENMTLASLGRFTSGPLLSLRAENAAANRLVSELQIKTAGLDRPVTSLSGGNQQKIVIAKCLMTSPKVLLMDEPTRGVDVSAKAEIYGLMRRLAREGMAIVFASSELEEVRAMADRILVLARGVCTAEYAAADATDALLMAAASQAGAA